MSHRDIRSRAEQPVVGRRRIYHLWWYSCSPGYDVCVRCGTTRFHRHAIDRVAYTQPGEWRSVRRVVYQTPDGDALDSGIMPPCSGIWPKWFKGHYPTRLSVRPWEDPDRAVAETKALRDGYFPPCLAEPRPPVQPRPRDRPCPFCQRIFNSREGLKTHARAAHQPLPMCPYCQRTFMSGQAVDAHARASHMTPPRR